MWSRIKYFFISVFFILILALISACGSGGGSRGSAYTPREPFGKGISLAAYTAADIKPNPVGEGAIIGGQLIVDFSDLLTLDGIDSILADNDFERIGFIPGINQAIAKIMNGANELDARAAIVAVPGVEEASLDFIVSTQTTSGVTQPLLDNNRAPNKPLLTLSDTELLRNWPHYVMDTFPAHALADAVIGKNVLRDVVIGVVEASGFHKARADVAGTPGSLLEPGDLHLYPKLVDPAGIKYNPVTQVASLIPGTKSPNSNKLISSDGSKVIDISKNLIRRIGKYEVIHGLEVASAALAAGPHVLGTSRHAKFRPIKISSDPLGLCKNDASIGCDDNVNCPPGAGSCDTEIAPTSWFSAIFAALAKENAPNMKVVNVSLGYDNDISDLIQRVAARKIIGAPLSQLVSGGRVVTIAAGNDGKPTSDKVLAALGSSRPVDRNTSSNKLDKGLMVVSGTALPTISTSDLGRLVLNPLHKPGPLFVGKAEVSYSTTGYGANISVAAPGEYVPVLATDFNDFRVRDGTSLSSPYTAGLAAELFALDDKLTNLEVVNIIEATADDLGDSDADDIFGNGRINLWKAMLTVLNRKDTANPKWFGINIRWGLLDGVPEQIFIGGKEVADTLVARVPDVARVLDDNSREVPSITYLPYTKATKFSFETNEIDGAVLIEAKESGVPIFQFPVRVSDLLNERPFYSSFDDFVVTLDLEFSTQPAAVWGRATSKGRPVSGVIITYEDSSGDTAATTATDNNGYYTIYDAKPNNKLFEISASRDGYIGESDQIRVKTYMATPKDFVLEKISSDFGYPSENVCPKSFVKLACPSRWCEENEIRKTFVFDYLHDLGSRSIRNEATCYYKSANPSEDDVWTTAYLILYYHTEPANALGCDKPGSYYRSSTESSYAYSTTRMIRAKLGSHWADYNGHEAILSELINNATNEGVGSLCP